MSRIVLLGDSTLDNAAYVPAGQSVVDHLRSLLPDGWGATLLAVDGARIEDVHEQLRRLPADADRLALSVGGNDLLAEAAVLGRPASTVGQAMLMLDEVRRGFEARYTRLLAAVAALDRPAVACTVYEPRFPDPLQRRAAAAALGLFDDAIVRVARLHGVPTLELRSVCFEHSDFANPIEPSSSGGRKIATAVMQALVS
jgi:hypothetical protein